MYQLARENLNEFLLKISAGREVVALEERGTAGANGRKGYRLARARAWDPQRHVLGRYRPQEPLKAMVFPPREAVGAGEGGGARPAVPERIAIGVKNCDLVALRVHDFVFLRNDPVDPFYAEARAQTILVSCDCTEPREVCFCPAVKEQPYAREGFDINLSPLADGVVVESGSDRGKALLDKVSSLLQPASDGLVKARDRQREAVTEKACALAAAQGLKCGQDYRKAVEGSRDADLWDEFAEDCVECGACNFCCCTCHCFLLADGRDKAGRAGRSKLWDSCLYQNFARVAGGANPRKHRAERLYNRFDKKFSFFPQVLGSYACHGCGRCVESCTGKIDIRRVLQRAVHGIG